MMCAAGSELQQGAASEDTASQALPCDAGLIVLSAVCALTYDAALLIPLDSRPAHRRR